MGFFLKNISLNSVTTFVITVKGLKPANSCVRDQDATTAPARQMLKLSIIHASMIYQIP